MSIFLRLIGLLPKGTYGRGIMTIMGAAAISQVIIAASSPILTRLYSPADVGAFSVAASILAVLITVTCLRYEWAIPLPESDVSGANVLALCLGVTAGLSVVSAIILWLFGPWLVALFGITAIGPYVGLLVLGQLSGGVVLALTSWAIRTKAFAEIGANRLTQTGVLVGLQVGLGIAAFGGLGLFIGSVAGNIAASGRLTFIVWRRHGEALRRVSWDGVRAAASRYRRFPLFSAPSALVNAVGLQAPLLIFTALFGVAAGGEYALAQRVVALPVSLAAGAVEQVFFAEAARLAREEPTLMRGLFIRTTRGLAVTTIWPFLLLGVTAPILAPLVFGQNWAQAGLYIAILAPMCYLQIITAPTGGTLDVLERQDLHLAREILRLVFVGAAAIVAWRFGLGQVQTVIVLSIAGGLTYSVYGLTSWRAIVSRPARRRRKAETESESDENPVLETGEGRNP
jgi:O-antigen/teichoic acid export membrane protein